MSICSAIQPSFLPDKFEAGTPNLPGIYGWEAALEWLEKTSVEQIRQHDRTLSRRFLDGLAEMHNIRLIGSDDPARRVAVFSLDFPGKDNALIGDRLEQDFGILTRCGLHCAPNAHKSLGTYPGGTVRLSFGYFNTEAHVDAALHALRSITAP